MMVWREVAQGLFNRIVELKCVEKLQMAVVDQMHALHVMRAIIALEELVFPIAIMMLIV